MLDPKAQARFNKSCSDAAFGYANASTAAYAEMTGRAMEMWTQSFQSLLSAGSQEKEEPRSWYRKPQDGEIFPPPPKTGSSAGNGMNPFAPSNPFAPMAEWMQANPYASFAPFARTADSALPFMGSMPTIAQAMASALPGSQNMAAAFANPFWPMSAWWNFAQSSLPPSAWPMAFGMIAAGVPEKVAFPTAEANAAAMDAAKTASESIDQAFSQYRSGGGHASAQVVQAGPFMVAFAIAPLSAATLMPWLNLPTGTISGS